MIHTVIVRNYLGEKLEIDLRKPYDHGLAITSITGVGESEAEINLGEYASSDGGYFNSSRVLSRILTLSIQFLEAPTIDDVRHTSYKFFPAKRKVQLEFITDRRHSMIEGYVEKNLATVFDKGVGTKITIICPDSAFKSVTVDEEWFHGEKPLFSFPFSNTSTSVPTIIFGEIRALEEEVVYYSGEREAGMLISLKVNGKVENIEIHNIVNREMMSIDTSVIQKITGKALGKGDEILISTVPGNKYARLLREGEFTNILGSIRRGSDWLTLSRGDNIFSYTASEGSDDLIFRVQYQSLFEGI